MNKQAKEARALKRQIRHVLKTSGGRLELGGSRVGLLRSIGRFLDRMKFESREEAARTLGIQPSKLDYVIHTYRKLPREQKGAGIRSGKKLKLARVKIVDEAANDTGTPGGPIELMLESGVKVSVASAEAAIDLLDLLEQRSKLKAAS